jgi:TonB-dependent receptor
MKKIEFVLLSILLSISPNLSSSEVLEEVTITSIRDAAAIAAEQQKNADGITNVVASDTVGKLPDSNIAEALQRVSGISIQRDQGEGRYINVRGAPSEFTNITVNGVSLPAPDPFTRAIDLDTIPSNIADSLEISKTLTPDQDADSIAGAVNIKTQSPFKKPGFQFRTEAGGSYNQFGSTNDKRASFSVSNTLSEDRFGVLLSVSYSETVRQPDNVETVWDRYKTPEGGIVFAPVEVLFKDYDTNRERVAFTSSLEFRPSVDTNLYLNSTWSQFTDDEYRNRLSILYSEGKILPGATDNKASFASTRIEKQIRHRIQENHIFSNEIGVKQQIWGGELKASVSLATAKQDYPRRDELLFRSSLRPTINYDYSVNARQPYISLFDTKEHLDVGRYNFRENAYRDADTKEDVIAFAADYEIDTFKFGVKYSDSDRNTDSSRWRNRAASAAPSTNLAGFLTDSESKNYQYMLGYKFNTELSDQYFDLTKPNSPPRVEQSLTEDYAVEEKIAAAYGMVKYRGDKFGLVAGIRVENTNNRGSAPVFNAQTGSISSQNSENDYTNVFPGLNVRYSFSENLIGRVALTRGLARPNFDDMVPRTSESQEGAQLVVVTGNPDLAPTLSNNIDLSLEYYFGDIGIASVSAFYKDLKDYNYVLRSNGTYTGNPAILVRPENAPKGEISGIEVNFQKQFDNGFGVFANYTLADASIDVGQIYSGRNKFPLPGQSDYTGNIAVFYEKGKISARLSYTDRSEFLNEINADDAELDLYWDGRGQLDFTVGYKVNRNFEAVLEAKNLTNSAGVRYYGSKSRVYEYEKFGYNVYFGIKFKK